MSEEILHAIATGALGDVVSLTKRELFAAMVMQGVISRTMQGSPGSADAWTPSIIATKIAVRYADALIARLAVEPGHE